MALVLIILVLSASLADASNGINGSVTAYVEQQVKEILDGPTYNKHERPYKQEGIPLEVAVNTHISSISGLSEITMDYGINFYLRQEWKDPRISFKHLTDFNETITLYHEFLHDMWVPDVFISNEKTSGDVHDIPIPNIMLRLSPDGMVLLSQRISTKITCNMDLHQYPMDNQECKLQLEVYGNSLNDIVIKWKSMEHPVQIRKDMELPEFTVKDYKVGTCSEDYVTGAFGCIYTVFVLKRNLVYYVIQVYLPSVLIVILSWVSFWIDRHSPPARVSLGLLTVLTITTQASGISARLPRVSYMKAIDIWMFTCGLFIFAAFLEYSIVNTLARQYKQTQQKLIRKKSMYIKKGNERPVNSSPETDNNSDVEEGKKTGSYNVAFVEDLNEDYHPDIATESKEKSVKLNNRFKSRRQKFAHSIRKTKVKTKRQYARFWEWVHKLRTNKALLIDDLSRILFPAAFLLFNLIYWWWFYMSQ